MAELKNNFFQGKMNKDLDQRILPKGQYRDAMNIQVTSSDESDAGTVQNILSNESMSNIAAFDGSCRCVGSIADPLTDHVYWFVRCDDRDSIVRYSERTDESVIVVSDLSRVLNYVDEDNNPVDVPSFLNFTGEQITAINIIDNYLFFTDGNSEPKKIDLSKDYTNYGFGENGVVIGTQQSFRHHSVFRVNDIESGFLTEADITVIKKKPSLAPLVRISSSDSEPEKSIFKKDIPRFCVRYKYDDNQLSAFGPFTQPVFNAAYVEASKEFFSNQSIYYNANTFYDDKEYYNTAMLNYISSIELYNFVQSDTPADVIEIELLYKNENSNVIYSIAKIKRSDPEWVLLGDYYSSDIQINSEFENATGSYVISSENITAAIAEDQFLRPYDNVPKLARAQEIVGNRLIYGNYTQNYNVDTVDLSANYESNSSFRFGSTYNTDSLNKTLKSQRKYQIGVLFGDEYGRETPIFTSANGSVNVDWQTQGYAEGVDAAGNPVGLGLETILNASSFNRLTVSLNSIVPEFASYYKFYVKESSGDYFNLLCDRVYIPFVHNQFENNEDHIYLAFPSKDRSKLTEDDYIILKTVLKNPSYQVAQENKYKVIDISNEAPKSISYKFYEIGAISNETNLLDGIGLGVNQSGVNYIFPIIPGVDDQLHRPDHTTDVITIDIGTFHALGNDGTSLTLASFVESSIEQLYISFSAGGQHSKRYKVTNYRQIPKPNYYTFRLSERISLEDALIVNTGGLVGLGDNQSLAQQQALPEDMIFKIERKDDFEDENFSGNFFVKIRADKLIRDELVNEGLTEIAPTSIIQSNDLFLWVDETSNTNSITQVSNAVNDTQIDAIYADGDTETVQDIHNGDGLTDTVGEWDALLDENIGFGSGQGKFFIDGMYMAAANPSQSTIYARNAGQGWLGAKQIRYPQLLWRNYTSNFPTNNSDTLYSSADEIDRYRTYKDLKYYGWVTADYNNFQTYEFEDSDADQELIDDYFETDLEQLNASTQAPNIAENVYFDTSYVNGVDPFLTANNDFTGDSSGETGSKRWVANSIYGENRVQLDTDYQNGRHYMHFSFFAPGKDLFQEPNSFPNEIPMLGRDALGKYLQGIWGGGAFTKDGGGIFNNQTQGCFVEMEGHYYASDTMGSVFNQSDQNTPDGGVAKYPVAHPASPGPGAAQNVGEDFETVVIGYNSNFTNDHNKQFDPTYNNVDETEIQNVLNNLTEGSRFKFSNDANDKAYTILNVELKYVYNHTPWRKRQVWDGQEWIDGGDSVEEAVVAWADNWAFSQEENFSGQVVNVDYISTQNEDGDGYNDEFQTVLDKLTAFGSRSNRRVLYILELDSNPASVDPVAEFNPLSQLDASFGSKSANTLLQFLGEGSRAFSSEATINKSIFETEPQESVDLDIYYEASNAIPTSFNSESAEVFAPVGSEVKILDFAYANQDSAYGSTLYVKDISFNINTNTCTLSVRGSNDVEVGYNYYSPVSGDVMVDDYIDKHILITRPDGSYSRVVIESINEDQFTEFYTDGEGSGNYGYIREFVVSIDTTLTHGLSFYNAFSFGNGVESDTIRDDFNGNRITTGARASTTLDEPYNEEIRENGLIFSGIYNSDGRINNLNQFIQAQGITKDLNPTYGSIQKLFQRQTDLVVFCEDKVVKVLSNKDAIFNADGNPQLVANKNVLGQVTPFVGDFGISTNPESFASESYRAYFTDKQKRAVLRLSMDGLTPISDAGMRDWFRDNLSAQDILCLGTYDENKKEYNLTLRETANTNIIQNAFLANAVDNIVAIQNQNELIVNPNFNGGENYQDISFLDTVFETENDLLFSGNENYNFQDNLVVFHYEPIPAESLYDGYGDDVIVSADETFLGSNGSWSYNNGEVISNLFGDNLENISDDESIFPIDNDLGSGFPKGTYRPTGLYDANPYIEAYNRRYHYRDTNGNVVSLFPEYGGPAHPSVHRGIIFSTPTTYAPDPNNPDYQVTFPTSQRPSVIFPQTKIGSTSQFRYGQSPAIYNWGPDSIGNTTGVDFTGTDHMTVFNGEEIFVKFTVKCDNWDTFDKNCYFALHLWDGDAALPSNYALYDYGNDGQDGELPYEAIWGATNGYPAHYGAPNQNYEGSTPDQTELFGTDFRSNFGNQQGTAKGYCNTTQVRFPDIYNAGDLIATGADLNQFVTWRSADDEMTFSAYFKLKNPEFGNIFQPDLGNNQGIAVNDLKFRIIFYHTAGGGSSSNDVYAQPVITGVYYKKIYRLETPRVIGQDDIDYGPDAPFVDVPGWAQLMPANYEGNFGWVIQNIAMGNELGLPNPGQTLSVLNGVPGQVWYAPPVYPADQLPTSDYSLVSNYSGNGSISYDPQGIEDGTFEEELFLNETTSRYRQEIVVGGDILMQPTALDQDGNINPSNAQFYTNGVPINAGDWYLIEVRVIQGDPINDWFNLPSYQDGTEMPIEIVTQPMMDVVGNMFAAGANGATHLNPLDGYPEFSFGRLDYVGLNDKGMILMPVIRTWAGEEIPVLAAIVKSDININTFRISARVGQDYYYQTPEQARIESVKIYNISQGSTMTEPPGWDILDSKYDSAHTLTPFISQFFPTALAEVYYKNGKVNWNTTIQEGSYLIQGSSDSLETGIGATSGGYLMTFEVSNNADTNTIEGSLIARATNIIYPDGEAIATGFQLTNINTPGIYEISFNYTNPGFPQIVSQPEGSQAELVDPDIDDNNGLYEFITGPDGFTGAVNNASVTDQSLLFSDGAIGSWSLTQYATWTDELENIQFEFDVQNDVAVDNLIAAQQQIGNLQEYSSYKLSFIINGLSNFNSAFPFPFGFYYFNEQGLGFAVDNISQETVQSGIYNEIHTVGETSILPNYPNAIVNALVFYIDTSNFEGLQDYVITANLDDVILSPSTSSGFENVTLSYSESVKGWISFKSFVPESGLSLGANYYTFNLASIYKHHMDQFDDRYNRFYGAARVNSNITFVFNDVTSTTKDFNAIAYEGSRARIQAFSRIGGVQGNNANTGANNAEPYNLSELNAEGWFVNSIQTDLQQGSIPEFIKKEGRYYNYIRGVNSINLDRSDDTARLNVQGLGIATGVINQN